MIARSVRKEIRANIVLNYANGMKLVRAELMKYSGTIIDDKLRFKDHCEYMLKQKKVIKEVS